MRTLAGSIVLSLLLVSAAHAQTATGKATYDKNCASCHGADGKGKPAKAKILKIDANVLNLGRAESAGLSRDERRNIVMKGKAKMPAYEKKLKPEEIDAVVEHAEQLASAIRGGAATPATPATPATAATPATPAAPAAAGAGKATYDKMCASCHGADGKGNAGKAKLLKIDANLLNLARPEAATTTRDQKRDIILKGKKKMPGYAKKLKPAEVDAVLEYAEQLAKAK